MFVVTGQHKDGVTGHVSKGQVTLVGNPTIYRRETSAIAGRLEAHRQLGEVGMGWDLDIQPLAEYVTTANK